MSSLQMNKTQIILIVGFISIVVVLYLGFDNLAKNQPKSDFEVCMEKVKDFTWDDGNDEAKRVLMCRGHG